MDKKIKLNQDFLKKLIMPDKSNMPRLEDTPSEIIWKALKKSGIVRTSKK